MARTTIPGSAIRDASVDLTVDVTGILPAANGGTGNTTNALNNVLLGNGTSALQTVAPSTAGNALRSNGTTWQSQALVKGDVGLGSVDNTADTAKPVSTAQQTALDLKAPLASPTLTGTPAAPTAAGGTNTTQVATTAFVQTAANAKVADALNNGTTDVAPSQNVVFDALALKVDNVSGATGLWIGTVASLPGTGTANVLYVAY